MLSIEFLDCFPPIEASEFGREHGSKFLELINDFYKCKNKPAKKFLCPLVDSVLERCNDLENFVIASVEEGQLSTLKTELRQVFGASCLIKAYITLRKPNDDCLEEVIRTLDFAILLGVPVAGWDVARALDIVLKGADFSRRYFEDKRTLIRCDGEEPEEIDTDNEEERRGQSFSYERDEDSPEDIPVEDLPSVQLFFEHYYLPNEPVKITGCMDDWAALVKWKYLGYLNRIAGARIVPVEMGDYSRQGTVRLVTLSEYLDDLYSGKTAEECGYLAQHQLLDQVPQLLQDIVVPDYCAVTEFDEITMNIWLGPAKTLTPLHVDPQANFLCQVVGRKTVTLFAPEDKHFLYPCEDRFSNTSQIDILNPDLDKFPEFENATSLSVTLHPGEMLFIPPGWWHAVQSVDVSFSVNFFFGETNHEIEE